MAKRQKKLGALLCPQTVVKAATNPKSLGPPGRQLKNEPEKSELLSVQSSDDGVWNKVEDGAVNED